MCSHRRFSGRSETRGREGGRDWSLGIRVEEEKERERERAREKDREKKIEGQREREEKKIWEVGKAHLLKGNIVHVHRRCS